MCREVPDHPKALFRQASVQSVLGNFDDAEEGYRYENCNRAPGAASWPTERILMVLYPHLHRRVAEVDLTLQEDMQREIVRMRQRRRAAAVKQKAEFQSFFGKRES